jgi:mono/diheme cytochrome c family protein
MPILNVVLAALGLLLGPQDPAPQASGPEADPTKILGKELYERACARCHGADGKGDRPDIELDAPMPNFARCAESAEEPDRQWRLTVEKGGPIYGLSSQMPAYGEVLTAAQIDSLLRYLRTFCRNPRWVRGELNFERPMFAEKAYPENELVVVPRVTRERGAGVGFSVEGILERRVGPRTQLELVLPVETIRPSPSTERRKAGAGDVELSVKQVLYASLARSLIATGGFEVALPTGRRSSGIGAGTTRYAPFLSAGKRAGDWVLQGQLKLELPADRSRAERELGYAAAVGYPVGRLGSIRPLFGQLELVGLRELVRGASNEVMLVPQLRLPIDRLGRWAVAAGPTLPLTRREGARVGCAAYLLYEYLGR